MKVATTPENWKNSPTTIGGPQAAVSGASATFAVPAPLAVALPGASNWGDGSPPAPGVISANPSGFDVSGSHNFSSVGKFTVAVNVADVGGSTAAVVCTATVVTSAPLLDLRGLATLVVILTGLGVLALRRAA